MKNGTPYSLDMVFLPKPRNGRGWGERKYPGQKPDEHCLSQVAKSVAAAVNHRVRLCPRCDRLKIAHYLRGPKTHNPNLIIRKASDKFQQASLRIPDKYSSYLARSSSTRKA